jgi:hypothetical protein
MKKIIFFLLLFFTILSLACSISGNSHQEVKGSGSLISETRPVSGFSSVELASSAEVSIRIGESETVVVKTDDNILPYIRTTVRGDTLIIDTNPGVSVNTDLIQVVVTMKSLEKASLTGSGSITADGLNEKEVTFSMPGSGDITAFGTAQKVTIRLNGSGNIQCGELQAKSADVIIKGSGNVTVNASESLVARIPGSGNINYRGNPADIKQNVSGSGNISVAP